MLVAGEAKAANAEHDGEDDDTDNDSNWRDDVWSTRKLASMLWIRHRRLSRAHCKRTRHNALAASVAIKLTRNLR